MDNNLKAVKQILTDKFTVDLNNVKSILLAQDPDSNQKGIVFITPKYPGGLLVQMDAVSLSRLAKALVKYQLTEFL